MNNNETRPAANSRIYVITRRICLILCLLTLIFLGICQIQCVSPQYAIKKANGARVALSIRLTDQFKSANNATPPPLLFDSDNKPITTKKHWEAHRKHLLKSFENNVYGRAPDHFKQQVDIADMPVPGIHNASRKQMHITIHNAQKKHTILADLILPAPTNQSADKSPPVVILLNHRDQQAADPTQTQQTDFWPVKSLLQAGFATCSIDLSSIDPDFDDGFQNGIHAVFPALRGPRSWATIAAWAWGVQRVIDALEAIKPQLNLSQIAVVGHSRGGKTALWAAAQDSRIAIVFSNNSGCTGAALSRRRKGETLLAMNSYFPHWFCQRYHDYNEREDSLPIDQHQLLALIAPRKVYVASGADDFWADPDGEFLSCKLASPVYRLYNKQGLSQKTPNADFQDHSGAIAYHRRPGGHELTLKDWRRFIQYLKQSWRSPNTK